MKNNLLALFQLCDSNFPSGGFSHSFGMETYVQSNEIHNPETFAQWLEMFLKEQLTSSDALAIKIAFEALETENLEEVWRMDKLLTIQNIARETREGTQHMGRSFIKTANELYEDEYLKTYGQRIKSKMSYGHSAIVFTLAGFYLKISKKDIILYYLYTIVINLVQNAVRSIPIGQTAGQKIIKNFQSKLEKAVEEVMQMTEKDFGTIAPGIELAQMKHEHVNIRIFMS